MGSASTLRKMNGLRFTQLIAKSPAGGIESDRNGFGKVSSILIEIVLIQPKKKKK